MNRPKLKISDLTNLQDARYAAAVGFDYVSFNLARGSNTKLAPATVWNIAQWIEGPAILIDSNAESLEEIETVNKQVDIDGISLPIKDLTTGLETAYPLRVQISTAMLEHAPSINELKNNPRISGIEVEISSTEDFSKVSSFADSIFVHVNEHGLLRKWIEDGLQLPMGFSLGNSVKESNGELNYEVLDELIEWYDELFEREW